MFKIENNLFISKGVINLTIDLSQTIGFTGTTCINHESEYAPFYGFSFLLNTGNKQLVLLDSEFERADGLYEEIEKALKQYYNKLNVSRETN